MFCLHVVCHFLMSIIEKLNMYLRSTNLMYNALTNSVDHKNSLPFWHSLMSWFSVYIIYFTLAKEFLC
jgi:hypothetical protein